MLLSDHSLPNHLGTIVVDGPDCIEDGSDYTKLLIEINQISEGFLNLENIACDYSDKNWNLSFNNQGKNYKVTVPHSEYFDNTIIEKLNEIIKEHHPKESRKLFTLEGGNYDFGVCFTTLAYEIELANDNLIWRSGGWKEAQEKKQILKAQMPSTSADGVLDVWAGHFKIKSSDVITLFKLMITEREGNKFSGLIHEGNDFKLEKNKTIKVQGELNGEDIVFEKYYGSDYYIQLIERMKSTGMPVDDYIAPTQTCVITYVGTIKENKASGTWTKAATDGTFFGMNINDPETGVWEMTVT